MLVLSFDMEWALDESPYLLWLRLRGSILYLRIVDTMTTNQEVCRFPVLGLLCTLWQGWEEWKKGPQATEVWEYKMKQRLKRHLEKKKKVSDSGQYKDDQVSVTLPALHCCHLDPCLLETPRALCLVVTYSPANPHQPNLFSLRNQD